MRIECVPRQFFYDKGLFREGKARGQTEKSAFFAAFGRKNACKARKRLFREGKVRSQVGKPRFLRRSAAKMRTKHAKGFFGRGKPAVRWENRAFCGVRPQKCVQSTQEAFSGVWGEIADPRKICYH
jgi:hypothetical protein